MSDPYVSVVVCTYNRASYLRRMLTSFVAQPHRSSIAHELIVVDNNSTDETASVVESFVRDHGVRSVIESKQGLSHARNRGIEETTGEFVAFLDDDVLVDPAWLEQLATCARETNAAVIGGRSSLVFEQEPEAWLGRDFRKQLSEVDLGDERRPVRQGERLFGLNLTFRRDALLKAGAFDPALGRTGSNLLAGEEIVMIDQIAAAGGAVYYEPRAVVGHIIAPDRVQWSYFERLSHGVGVSIARASARLSLTRLTGWVVRDIVSLAGAMARGTMVRLLGGSAYDVRRMRSVVIVARARLGERVRVLGRRLRGQAEPSR
jgi:glycosyltransferase involved in cell wall biosynthesis